MHPGGNNRGQKYSLKYSFSFLFLFTLLVFSPGCTGLRPEIQQPKPIGLTLLFFNDLHGHLSPFKVKGEDGVPREVGGIGRVATLVREIRTENAARQVKTIVLVAGDILQGTPMSTVFQGEPDVLALNLIGVDAMTVGNHEFDFGLENFLKLKATARFPFLSANIFYKDSGKPLCDSGVAFQLTDTLSLTVLGVTTEQLMVTTLPANVEALTVTDSVTALKEACTAALQKGPVLLLSHSRHQTDREIALSYPKLAAIIGGHDQILMDPHRRVGDVPVFQAFEKGRYVGRADLLIDPVTFESRVANWTYLPVTDEIQADKTVSGLVEMYETRLDDSFKAVIGRAKIFLDAERERIRYEETNLGNWVTDVMRGHTGADMAFLNSGSLRASIADGPVTIADVYRAMPYANALMTVELSGKDILAILNRSVMGSREDEDGGFLQVSGIRFGVRNHRVEAVQVGENGGGLDPEKRYSVAITDFMAAGGDGYTSFKGKPVVDTGLPLRELLIDTVRRKKVISAAVEGRVVRVGD
ncbi:MAG: 5'-nucleotidase C-terminal domain-containing protein [Pseudomonadota bacterium]